MDIPENYFGLWGQLRASLLRLVRLDSVGPLIPPNLIGRLPRTFGPDGQPYGPGVEARYPGASLTLSPPRAKEITNGQIQWRVTGLVAWSFPNYSYSQLPVGHAAHMASRLSNRLPKPFRLTEAEVGAEQLEGSEVWTLLLRLVVDYNQPADPDLPVGELQPQDYGLEPAPAIDQINVGLWRSPIPLTPEESELDVTLDLNIE